MLAAALKRSAVHRHWSTFGRPLPAAVTRRFQSRWLPTLRFNNSNGNSNQLIYGIIGINTVVYLQWRYAQYRRDYMGRPDLWIYMTNHFTFSMSSLREGRWWCVFTSMFSQAQTFHYLFNMFVLYSFGPMVVGMLGPASFIRLYMAGGLSCHLATAGYQEWQRRRRRGIWSSFQDDWHSLGASGNIMALTAYFACVYPQASFLLFGIVPVPAWLCVSGLVGYDVMTGHAGHVGGALYGGLYYLYKNRRRIPGRRW